MRINGKLVATYGKDKGGLIYRVLEVYETKTLLKAILWNSSFKGWKSEPHEPIKVTRYKKTETTIEEIVDANEFTIKL